MRIGNHRIEIDERGAIALSTFEQSPGLKVHMLHPSKNPQWLVLNAPGHKRFGGQGRSVYQEAQFLVYEIEDVDAESSTPGHFVYEIRRVLTIPKR